MNRWAIYEENTGYIYGVYSGTEANALLQLKVGEAIALIESELFDTTAYVVEGEVVPKQSLPLQMTSTQIIADGIDECVIGNIPAGVSVTWPDGQTDVVTDGEVRFSVDLAGTYTLIFTAIPYLDQEITIEAIPAA